MGHVLNVLSQSTQENNLKGAVAARFPVDSNSDSEEHMQLLNNSGFRNELSRITKVLLR